MGWIKVDDHMVDHPKIFPLSDAAFRWVHRALSYANRYLTDGKLPEAFMAQVPTKVRDELVLAKVWKRRHKSVWIHGYSTYQPTREQVERERAVVRLRVAKWRAAQTEERNVNGNDVTDSVTRKSVTPLVTPPPAREEVRTVLLIKDSTSAKSADENSGIKEELRKPHALTQKLWRQMLALAHAVIEDTHGDRSQWSDEMKHRCIIQGLPYALPGDVNNVPVYRRALLAVEHLRIQRGQLEP